MAKRMMTKGYPAKSRAKNGARLTRKKVEHLLALGILALSLGGCGNCNGWTNPWYAGPHSCDSDHAARSFAAPLPAE
jgi:hypothetical protein